MSPQPSSFRKEDYTKKKRKERLVRFGIGALIVCLIIGLLSYISYNPSLRISRVELRGAVLVSGAEVEAETLSYLYGSYLWLVPHGSAFVYPKAKLAEDLKNHFKRIDQIAMHLDGFHTLIIQITERKPQSTWCDTLPDTGPSEKCYFIDNDGMLYAEAPQFSGDAYFKYFGKVSTDHPIGSTYFASSTRFAEVEEFVSRAQRLGLHPLYIVPRDGDELALVLSGGGQIYFDFKQPLSRVADNLEALLRTTALANSSRDGLPVDYIDLRFGNKLFYKLRGTSTPPLPAMPAPVE